jgi:hypothetical protein
MMTLSSLRVSCEPNTSLMLTFTCQRKIAGILLFVCQYTLVCHRVWLCLFIELFIYFFDCSIIDDILFGLYFNKILIYCTGVIPCDILVPHIDSRVNIIDNERPGASPCDLFLVILRVE